jgi:hypothetical protein
MKKLVKICRKVNSITKMGIFLGIVNQGKVVMYCSENDVKSFFKNTIMNRNMSKILIDKNVVNLLIFRAKIFLMQKSQIKLS